MSTPTKYQVALTAQDQEVELETFSYLKRCMCSYQGSCMGVPSDRSLRNVRESQHLLSMFTNPGVSGTASAMTLCVTGHCKLGDIKEHMILSTVCVGPSPDEGRVCCSEFKG